MIYDIVIIGGGPAGLSAALYASRAGRKTLVLEKAWTGGQIFQTHRVENYPGLTSISGPDLSQQLEEQARSFGAELKLASVARVDLVSSPKIITLGDGTKIGAQAIILAMGCQPRLLGIPGEREFTGRGVSYCATCDGRFFQGKRIAVIGGGDTALEEALFLTRYASEVILIHRRDKLRGTKVLQDRLMAEPKVTILWNTQALEIQGKQNVSGLSIQNTLTGAIDCLDIDGVFIYVGFKPNSELISDQVELDHEGFVLADSDTLLTNCSQVYAIGDLRVKPLRQVVTAVADGAIAAVLADRYLNN